MKVVINKYLEELGITEDNYWVHNQGKGDPRYQPDKDDIIEAETWNMDNTLSMIIYSYLRYFKDHCWYGIPAGMTQKQWDKTYNHILKAFELMLKDEDIDPSMYSNEEYKRKLNARRKKINYGLRLFIKYYRDLWW